MDVLKINENVIKNYTDYVTSFTDIQDKRIKETILDAINNYKLWKEPIIQFNPEYERGESIRELCDRGVLEKELENVFKDFRLHKHQTEALVKGANEESFIVTSGTGSGKSVTFIGTIFNYLFKQLNKRNVGGVKAIIVYPMNALINSQKEELEKHANNYKKNSGKDFPFTFKVYTGQENEEERNYIRNNPPDILLTNYMMLELILTRFAEKSLVNDISKNLKILAFDELHVYKGRQGSDVAILIRRIKALAKQQLVLIGTSATMASNKDKEENTSVIDAVSKIFGQKFYKESIITEKVKLSLFNKGEVINLDELKNYILSDNNQKDDVTLENNILAKWLEANAAVEQKNGFYVRKKPLDIKEIINLLRTQIGVDKNLCTIKIKDILNKININNSNSYNKKILPFKVHQFISQSGAVKVTLESPENRYITINDEVYYYDKDNNELDLFQIVFNYYSGQAYICVKKDNENKKIIPRNFTEFEKNDKNIKDGYIFFSDEEYDFSQIEPFIPKDWKGKNGLKEKYIERLPTLIYFDKFGNLYDKNDDGTKIKGYFIQAPLFFEPFSGIIYSHLERDYNKFASLGIEGRSTATNILILELLNELREKGINANEHKVLSFIDNRQDASLQSGHFNDFVNKLKIRIALYQALKNSNSCIFYHSNIDYMVFDYLNLNFKDYSSKSINVEYQKPKIQKSFQNLLFYNLILDLKYEWRIILPNLEKTGLIKIDYDNLRESIFDDKKLEEWYKLSFFKEFSKEELYDFVLQTLNFFRTNFALSHNKLEKSEINKNLNDIKENIHEAWINDLNEDMLIPNYILVSNKNKINWKSRTIIETNLISAGPQSAYGKYLKDIIINKNLYIANIEELILEIFRFLCKFGYLKEINNEGVELFSLDVSNIIWKHNKDGDIIPDKVRKRSIKNYSLIGNKYFKRLYEYNYNFIKNLNSKEHTAQISNEDRKEREEKFRNGEINLLCCSPTMELGIDISSLNFVHLRNVPPSPANYAQRAGRAGRSGQFALIYTFCGKNSEHDQHFFNKPEDMVAGIVEPPKFDLYNEDLLLTHLHAIALSKLRLNINNSITSIIKIDNEDTELKLRDEIYTELKEINNLKHEIINSFKETIKDFEDEIKNKNWYNDYWIENKVNSIITDFDNAFNRWRNLFNNAKENIKKATEILNNNVYKKDNKERYEADLLYKNSIAQIDMLKNESSESKNTFSEFYPYRYLAAEGFLPGYNFPSLPIRAFLNYKDKTDIISRRRFLAIKEFGPYNYIYHNNYKFKVHQLLSNNLSDKLKRWKVEEDTGFVIRDGFDNEFSPLTNEKIISPMYLTNLLAFEDIRALKNDYINCIEEERFKHSYSINTYFTSTADKNKISTLVVKSNNEELLKIKYLPTCNIIQINEGYKADEEYNNGFYINKNNGLFASKNEAKDLNKNKVNSNDINNLLFVKFYTEIVADAIYIFPTKALNFNPAKEFDSIITLQFALKKAFEKYFSIENNEIESLIMGNSNIPNILIYESAEGKLGILSQLTANKNIFYDLIKTAYEICHFKDGEDRPDIKKASYEDLLSYSNQAHHKIIDKYLIKQQLEMLLTCDVEILDNYKFNSIDEQYEYLLSKYDKNSVTERKFLEYLYLNDYKLPDEAQVEIKGLYVLPDFYYKDTNTLVFCDGTPHDDPKIKEDDFNKREALRKMGYNIFVYYYKDNLDELISSRKDIFIKVK